MPEPLLERAFRACWTPTLNQNFQGRERSGGCLQGSRSHGLGGIPKDDGLQGLRDHYAGWCVPQEKRPLRWSLGVRRKPGGLGNDGERGEPTEAEQINGHRKDKGDLN